MEQDSEEIQTSGPLGGVDSDQRSGREKRSGRWKAIVFLFGYEMLERMAWVVVAASLVNYLQFYMKENKNSVTSDFYIWVAVSCLASTIGGYLADAYLGFFWTILAFSCIYTSGLLMMTMSASIPSFNPSKCRDSPCPLYPSTLEHVFLFVALYVVATGTGGVWPALPAFGADQFDDRYPSEQRSRHSFFNWYFFVSSLGSLLSKIVLANSNVRPEWQFGIPTIAMTMAFAVLLSGVSFYRYSHTRGHPLTRIAQVVVATVRKRRVSLPDNNWRLYEDREIPNDKLAWNENSPTATPFKQPGPRKLCHTRGLRWFDKAAVIGSTRIVKGAARVPTSRWILCSVTQVEELKLVLRLVPIWIFTLMFNVVKSEVPFFVQEGIFMGPSMEEKVFRTLGNNVSIIISLVIVLLMPGYELILVPLVRQYTGNERGISLLQRIGIGMLFSILSMVAAAHMEILRRRHDDLSVFWLFPQLALAGLAEVFAVVGQLEFFYDQAPDSMRGMGIALHLANQGVAFFLSGVLLKTVNGATARPIGNGWADPNEIQRERLDIYYWTIVVVATVNFVIYMLVAWFYTYKKVDNDDVPVESRSLQWNTSELGLMQKPKLFNGREGNSSSLAAVLEAGKDSPLSNGIRECSKDSPLSDGIRERSKDSPLSNGIREHSKDSPLSNGIREHSPIQENEITHVLP